MASVNGYTRYNSEIKSLEAFVNGVWKTVATGVSPTGTEDGKSLRWNNTTQQFDWFTAGAAGSGIATINGDSSNAQTIVTGTSGTDFSISTSGGVTTVNIPTASATNRGALSSADWTTFNNKLAAITNIANLADGRFWIGDGTGKAQERTISGALTVSNTGVATLATVGIDKGGTGQTTATAGFNALSPLTTKGDLVTRDGTNNIRLAVGLDGKFLKADSAQASGLAWSDVVATDIASLATTGIVQRNGANSYSTVTVAAPLTYSGGTLGLSTVSGGSVIDGGNTVTAAMNVGSNAAFDLNLRTNSTTKMTIQSGGNVGIGTTAPSSIIGISGTSARTVGMERHTTADTAGNSLTIRAGGATSGATDKGGGSLILAAGISTGSHSSNSDIQFQTASGGSSGTSDNSPTTKMRLNSTGNLFIGNTSPPAIPWDNAGATSTTNFRQQVSGNGAGGGIGILTEGAGINGNSPTISFARTNGTIASPTIVGNGNYVMTLIGSGYDGTAYRRAGQIHIGIDGVPAANSMPGRIVFSTTASSAIDPVERMRIDSSGNVGIGTTTPMGNLAVQGASPMIYSSTLGTGVSDQAQFGLITSGNGTSALGQASTLGWTLVGRGNSYSGTSAQNDFQIGYWNGTVWSTPFAIDSLTGRIGVGTLTPGTSLDLASKTDAVALPSGTTAQRPASPVNGYTRYNSDLKGVEAYVNGGWQQIASGISPTGTEDGKSLRWNNTTKQFDWFTAGTAGSGIATINGDSTNAQTIVAGTAGTNFAISTSGGATTINLPTASATNRGALSSADWTTFNNKLAAITNIANLADGRFWIGDGTGKAQERTLSGALTVSNTGVATLATVGIATGGGSRDLAVGK